MHTGEQYLNHTPHLFLPNQIALVFLWSALLLPVTAYADSAFAETSNYTGAALSAPLHWHSVSALDPPYSEALYSVSAGAVHRSYPADGVGVVAELAYMHPWARVVRTEETSATTGRSDHSAWAGFRGLLGVSGRWFVGIPSSRDLSLFAHLDGGLQLVYYNREAQNIFGETSFQSSRISFALTARPGLVLEVRDSFFLGVDVLLGGSLVEHESVDRRYLQDIAYNSFFRGVFVVPGLSGGVSY